MKSNYIWLDGELVPYEEATVHFLSPTVQYGFGAFDGIHRGHQKLIDRVNSVARQRNGTGILVTFEPHPQHLPSPIVFASFRWIVSHE